MRGRKTGAHETHTTFPEKAKKWTMCVMWGDLIRLSVDALFVCRSCRKRWQLFLCECQLLLCCTSQRSLCDWCEPVLCPARAPWFLFRLQRQSNQSAVKTWPMVKHRKASIVSLQINHKAPDIFRVKATYVLSQLSWQAVINKSSFRMYEQILIPLYCTL